MTYKVLDWLMNPIQQKEFREDWKYILKKNKEDFKDSFLECFTRPKGVKNIIQVQLKYIGIFGALLSTLTHNFESFYQGVTWTCMSYQNLIDYSITIKNEFIRKKKEERVKDKNYYAKRMDNFLKDNSRRIYL